MEDLNELAGRVRRRRFFPGETIVRQGTAPDAFYLIRRGRCALIEETMHGHELTITHLGPGSTFGDLALLDGTPASATVRAECAAEAFAIDIGTFQRLLAPALTRPASPPPVTPVWTLAPFRHLNPAAATELAAGTWTRIAPGDRVIQQGGPGDTFYVLARGQLQAERDGTVVRSLHAGDFFGETPLLHGVPHTATMRALTPALLFAIPQPLFNRVLRASFQRTDLTAHLVPTDSPTPPSQQ